MDKKNTPPVVPQGEPVAYVTGTYGGRFVVEPVNRAMVLPVGMAFYTTPQTVTQGEPDSSSSGDSEPVARMRKHCGNTDFFTTTYSSELDDDVWYCLYTTPPVVPQGEPYAWEFAGTIFHDKDEVFSWAKDPEISSTPPLPLYTAPPSVEAAKDKK